MAVVTPEHALAMTNMLKSMGSALETFADSMIAASEEMEKLGKFLPEVPADEGDHIPDVEFIDDE